MIPQLTPEQLIQAAALFKSYAEGCVPYVNEKDFPGQIFWMKDGEYHFEYDKEYPDKFWVRYSIWLNFEQKISLNYKQVSDLLKPLVEDTFKLGQLTPAFVMNIGGKEVEDTFKLGQLTPIQLVTCLPKEVEEAFKSGQLMPMENAQQPKKGQYKGECYRSACSNTPALCYNQSTRMYYCAKCAKKINTEDHADTILLHGAQLVQYKEPFWKIEADSWRTDYAYCPEDNQYLAVMQYYNTFGPSLVFCKAPESHTNLVPSDAETFYSNYRKTVSEMFRLIPLNTPTNHAAANEENTARHPE